MDLATALAISARGMDAAPERLRGIAESLAGHDAARLSPGTAAAAADVPCRGALMREAGRNHAANMETLEAVRAMLGRTLDMLR